MFLIVGILALLIYLLFVVVEASNTARLTPRKPMFVCDKHGAVAEEYLIVFQLDGITKEPIKYCPFCYEERTKQAIKNVKQ